MVLLTLFTSHLLTSNFHASLLPIISSLFGFHLHCLISLPIFISHLLFPFPLRTFTSQFHFPSSLPIFTPHLHFLPSSLPSFISNFYFRHPVSFDQCKITQLTNFCADEIVSTTPSLQLGSTVLCQSVKIKK
jgi:hypothetical protein